MIVGRKDDHDGTQARVLDRFVVMPRVGHCSNLEAPQRFTQEILRLLRAAPESEGVG